MNHMPASITAWYASTSVHRMAVAVVLSLATLAVVLGYEHATPVPADGPPSVAALYYVNEVGAAMADEISPPSPPDASPVSDDMAPISHRDPSLPDVTFAPTSSDVREPSPATF